MKLHDQVAAIHTRDDLAAFVEALRLDLQSNPGAWENPTLERYLSALASWIEDMDGYYRNRGDEPPKSPTWRTVGEMLIAARIYE